MVFVWQAGGGTARDALTAVEENLQQPHRERNATADLDTLCDEFSSYCPDLGFSLHLAKIATDFIAQFSTM